MNEKKVKSNVDKYSVDDLLKKLKITKKTTQRVLVNRDEPDVDYSDKKQRILKIEEIINLFFIKFKKDKIEKYFKPFILLLTSIADKEGKNTDKKLSLLNTILKKLNESKIENPVKLIFEHKECFESYFLFEKANITNTQNERACLIQAIFSYFKEHLNEKDVLDLGSSFSIKIDKHFNTERKDSGFILKRKFTEEELNRRRKEVLRKEEIERKEELEFTDIYQVGHQESIVPVSKPETKLESEEKIQRLETDENEGLPVIILKPVTSSQSNYELENSKSESSLTVREHFTEKERKRSTEENSRVHKRD